MAEWTTEYIAGTPRIAVDHTGSGPAVIFLHGVGGNRTNWHDQLPQFGRNFHAIAWDARGYGASDSARSNGSRRRWKRQDAHCVGARAGRLPEGPRGRLHHRRGFGP